MYKQICYEFFAGVFGNCQNKNISPFGNGVIYLFLFTHIMKCYTRFEHYCLLSMKWDQESLPSHRSLTSTDWPFHPDHSTWLSRLPTALFSTSSTQQCTTLYIFSQDGLCQGLSQIVLSLITCHIFWVSHYVIFYINHTTTNVFILIFKKDNPFL
jgi:hypothetical protein